MLRMLGVIQLAFLLQEGRMHLSAALLPNPSLSVRSKPLSVPVSVTSQRGIQGSPCRFKPSNPRRAPQQSSAAISISARDSSTEMSMVMVSGLGPTARAAACVVGAGVAAGCSSARVRGAIRNFLWPGSAPDRTLLPDYPRPEGSLGCPFRGSDSKLATSEFGPGAFFRRASERLGHPRIWKFFDGRIGRPGVVVSGHANSKALLSEEFVSVESNVVPFTAGMVGESSLRKCRDRREHTFLRHLVGASMGPVAVSRAVPALQRGAEKQIDGILTLCQEENGSNRTIHMEAVCKAFTLDVAWRQIIGLDLEEGEVPEFSRAVDNWANGVFAKTKEEAERALEAREYLVRMIEAKIERLQQDGPDESTVSGMVFATDEETKLQQLTRQQIIDNSLLLILGGTETSSSTLTNAIFLLGLHPDAWRKLVQEQDGMRSKYGEVLSKQQLDKHCPYLDSVVREALRLKPVPAGSMRGTTKSIVVDGKQIPKGWSVTFNIPLTHELDPVTWNKDGSHMDVLQGFVPERWLSDSTRPTTEFIPFGVGPRYCLGADLAMAEMKTFLAMMARQVDSFSLVIPSSMGKGMKWRKRGIIPVPEEGVVIAPLIVHARQSEFDTENELASAK